MKKILLFFCLLSIQFAFGYKFKIRNDSNKKVEVTVVIDPFSPLVHKLKISEEYIFNTQENMSKIANPCVSKIIIRATDSLQEDTTHLSHQCGNRDLVIVNATEEQKKKDKKKRTYRLREMYGNKRML